MQESDSQVGRPEDNPVDFVKQISSRGGDYREALLDASKNGHEEITRLLYEKIKDIHGGCIDTSLLNIAMHEASANGRENIVKFLLSKGANNYNTSMLRASYAGHMSIVDLMLERGADNYDHCMALAAESGKLQLIEKMILLGGRGFAWALRCAAYGGHIDSIKILVSSCDKNDYNEAMQQASVHGWEDIVRLLLQHGANEYNRSLVHAVNHGHINLVVLLLESGATNLEYCLGLSKIDEISNILKQAINGKVKL